MIVPILKYDKLRIYGSFRRCSVCGFSVVLFGSRFEVGLEPLEVYGSKTRTLAYLAGLGWVNGESRLNLAFSILVGPAPPGTDLRPGPTLYPNPGSAAGAVRGRGCCQSSQTGGSAGAGVSKSQAHREED